jgi:hypothetical protein
VPPLKDELVGKKAIVLYVFFGYSCVPPLKDRSLGKKTLPVSLFLYAFTIVCRYCSCALIVAMGSSSTSSNLILVL